MPLSISKIFLSNTFIVLVLRLPQILSLKTMKFFSVTSKVWIQGISTWFLLNSKSPSLPVPLLTSIVSWWPPFTVLPLWLKNAHWLLCACGPFTVYLIAFFSLRRMCHLGFIIGFYWDMAAPILGDLILNTPTIILIINKIRLSRWAFTGEKVHNYSFHTLDLLTIAFCLPSNSKAH